MRNYAKRLIELEAEGKKSCQNNFPEAIHVCGKLRPPLATLMGNGGFRALLSRALALASADIPWLRAAHVGADGALAGMAEIRGQLSAEASFEGSVELVAQLLRLLVAFIGENLALRLVREVWPSATLHERELLKGTNHE